MNFKEIIVTKANGITKITLNRPDKLNAWTTVMGNEVRKCKRLLLLGHRKIATFYKI